jgi:nicotinic acid phosphoribosyltransferase
MPDDRVLLNDAVKYLMKETGRTRRQAEALLKQELKSGRIRVTGVRADTGEVEEIPVEVFQSIPTEH